MTKLIVAAMFVVSGLAFSAFADEDHSGSTTVDHSKNPITGTKKTTVTKKMKHKNADGSSSSAKKTDTTKEKTDGSVEKSTKTETDSESK